MASRSATGIRDSVNRLLSSLSRGLALDVAFNTQLTSSFRQGSTSILGMLSMAFSSQKTFDVLGRVEAKGRTRKNNRGQAQKVDRSRAK
jgi:hypothetical protein